MRMENCEKITRKMLRDMPRGTSKDVKIQNFAMVLSARNLINQVKQIDSMDFSTSWDRNTQTLTINKL